MHNRRTHRRFALAAAAAVVGRGIHDVEEFGTVTPDFVVTGLLIPILLAILIPRFPDQRWLAWTGVAWGLLNVVLGGFLSVLPLPIWPFDPAQTLGHYGAHAAYLLGYLPLTWLAWSALDSNSGPS